MEKYGYTWEAMKVQTEDDYILTLFHLTGKVDSGLFTPSQPPLLINHGDCMDAASWFEGLDQNGDGALPYLFKFAENDYDVWMSNNRGTWYSQEHASLSAETDSEYWDFTWADMGLYDDTSNIAMVKQLTGYEKIFYVGYSQGTI